MIGLNQFRHGNLFQTKKRAKIKKFLGIHAISQNLYFTDEFNNIIDYTNFEIEPIPISKEWLLKFGFSEYDQMGDNYFFAIEKEDNFEFNLCLNFNKLQVSFYGLNWERAFKIESVHSLQNLYFTLTGQELTIQ